MVEKKNTEGLKFILRLNMVADDKDKLVLLAKQAVDESHDKRTFTERKNQDLRVNATSIKLGATIADAHVMLNNNLSTNDKLYKIMDRYINLVSEKHKITKDEALKHFCKDFANKFPQEYGKEQGVILNPMFLKKQREM